VCLFLPLPRRFCFCLCASATRIRQKQNLLGRGKNRHTCFIYQLTLSYLLDPAVQLHTVSSSTRKEFKKCSEKCKHCALAVVRRSQKFSPHRRPLPGGTGRPKFNQLEMVTTFTYKPSLMRIDAHNFELSW